MAVDEQQIHRLIIEHSSNRLEYGNPVPVYDLRRIEDHLLGAVQGRKKLDTDISHYRNVRFVGQTFINQGKFSSYLLEVRRLGNVLPLPHLDFPAFMPADKVAHHALLKQLLGSLQRILLAYRSLPEKNITLAQYCAKYGFSNVSPVLTTDSPIKDLDICTAVSLYEMFEQDSAEQGWKSVPEDYGVPLEEGEKDLLKDFFTRLYERNDDLPTFLQFKECLNRFCMRCLSLGEFNLQEDLTIWLCEKIDFWPHEYDQEKLYFLKVDMPPLQAKQALSLYRLMNEFESSVPAAIRQKMQELMRRTSSKLSRGNSFIS